MGKARRVAVDESEYANWYRTTYRASDETLRVYLSRAASSDWAESLRDELETGLDAVKRCSITRRHRG